jgi:hypothetical protein
VRRADVIPWKDVIRADRRGIVVRDDTRPSDPGTTAS